MRLGASEEYRDDGFTSDRGGHTDALATLRMLSRLLNHHPTLRYSFEVALAST